MSDFIVSETADYTIEAIPLSHAATHQDGGDDEISVAALSGELAAEQKSAWAKVSGKPSLFPPVAHKTAHQSGGGDEISVAALLGELAAEQLSAWNKVSGKPATFPPEAHKTAHQSGGGDEISVAALLGELAAEQLSAWAKVSDKPSTFAPSAHKTAHELTGSDEIDATGLDHKTVVVAWPNMDLEVESGTDTTIEFTSTVLDRNADFNTGNYTFVAPATGVYLFHLNVGWLDVVSAKDYEIYLKQGANYLAVMWGFTRDSVYDTGHLTALLALTQNDVVYAAVRQNSGDLWSVGSGPVDTFLSVIRIY